MLELLKYINQNGNVIVSLYNDQNNREFKEINKQRFIIWIRYDILLKKIIKYFDSELKQKVQDIIWDIKLEDIGVIYFKIGK